MIWVSALARGGFSCAGSSSYDARANVVMVKANDTEIVNITVSFPANISTINYDTNGVETTEPSISDATFTATLSNFNAGDTITYDVVMSDGEMREVSFEIAGASVRSTFSRSGDYGTFS